MPDSSPWHQRSKGQIRNVLHAKLHSAHPRIQRTIGKIMRSIYWKGINSNIKEFVEKCLVCQMEKSKGILSKGRLQFTHIPENKVTSPIGVFPRAVEYNKWILMMMTMIIVTSDWLSIHETSQTLCEIRS